MVSTCSLISMFSSPYTNPFVTVPRATLIISITVTSTFHSFFNSQARSGYLSFFSLSLNFILLSSETAKSTILQIFFFLIFRWLLQCLVVWPRLGDPFVSQNIRGVCALHFPGHILACAFTICLHGKTSISCTILIRSPCPFSHV